MTHSRKMNGEKKRKKREISHKKNSEEKEKSHFDLYTRSWLVFLMIIFHFVYSSSPSPSSLQDKYDSRYSQHRQLCACSARPCIQMHIFTWWALCAVVHVSPPSVSTSILHWNWLGFSAVVHFAIENMLLSLSHAHHPSPSLSLSAIYFFVIFAFWFCLTQTWSGECKI